MQFYSLENKHDENSLKRKKNKYIIHNCQYNEDKFFILRNYRKYFFIKLKKVIYVQIPTNIGMPSYWFLEIAILHAPGNINTRELVSMLTIDQRWQQFSLFTLNRGHHKLFSLCSNPSCH